MPRVVDIPFLYCSLPYYRESTWPVLLTFCLDFSLPYYRESTWPIFVDIPSLCFSLPYYRESTWPILLTFRIFIFLCRIIKKVHGPFC